MHTLKRPVSIIATFLAAFTLAIGIVIAPTALAADPSPQTVTGYAQYTLFAGTAITQSVSTLALNTNYKTTAPYGIADCYYKLDVTDTQTVSIGLLSGPDGSIWHTESVTAAGSVDATDRLDRITLYGHYTGITVTLGASNPVTVAVKCTLKNT